MALLPGFALALAVLPAAAFAGSGEPESDSRTTEAAITTEAPLAPVCGLELSADERLAAIQEKRKAEDGRDAAIAEKLAGRRSSEDEVLLFDEEEDPYLCTNGTFIGDPAENHSGSGWDWTYYEELEYGILDISGFNGAIEISGAEVEICATGRNTVSTLTVSPNDLQFSNFGTLTVDSIDAFNFDYYGYGKSTLTVKGKDGHDSINVADAFTVLFDEATANIQTKATAKDYYGVNGNYFGLCGIYAYGDVDIWTYDRSRFVLTDGKEAIDQVMGYDDDYEYEDFIRGGAGIRTDDSVNLYTENSAQIAITGGDRSGASIDKTSFNYGGHAVISYDGVAEIDENGILTAKQAGTVKITVTALSANRKITLTIKIVQ